MNLQKPLRHKSYGSIPHFKGSRTAPSDKRVTPGQQRIMTEKTRDKHDLIIVQEKLDGSNCSVAKINGKIYPLTRSGYIASTSRYKQYIVFSHWVSNNYERFDKLLNEGERVVGEWLYQAHGTKYNLPHEPYVVFDLMTNHDRLIFKEFLERVEKYNFIVPRMIYMGRTPQPIEGVIKHIKNNLGGHGNIDPVEGVVYRCERKEKVDFLSKYVMNDKEDGKYLPEISGNDEVLNNYPK